MNITKETTLAQLEGWFSEAEGKLISGGDFFTAKKDTTPADLQKEQPTWNVQDMIYGLDRLAKIKENGNYVLPVYPDCADPSKSSVGLLKMPADEKKSDTAVILCAGGAYGAVCTMVESLPVAGMPAVYSARRSAPVIMASLNQKDSCWIIR